MLRSADNIVIGPDQSLFGLMSIGNQTLGSRPEGIEVTIASVEFVLTHLSLL